MMGFKMTKKEKLDYMYDLKEEIRFCKDRLSEDAQAYLKGKCTVQDLFTSAGNVMWHEQLLDTAESMLPGAGLSDEEYRKLQNKRKAEGSESWKRRRLKELRKEDKTMSVCAYIAGCSDAERKRIAIAARRIRDALEIIRADILGRRKEYDGQD